MVPGTLSGGWVHSIALSIRQYRYGKTYPLLGQGGEHREVGALYIIYCKNVKDKILSFNVSFTPWFRFLLYFAVGSVVNTSTLDLNSNTLDLKGPYLLH